MTSGFAWSGRRRASAASYGVIDNDRQIPQALTLCADVIIGRHHRSPRPPELHRRPEPQQLKWNRRRRQQPQRRPAGSSRLVCSAQPRPMRVGLPARA
jgi:hypothetical protein